VILLYKEESSKKVKREAYWGKNSIYINSNDIHAVHDRMGYGEKHLGLPGKT